MTGGRRQEAGGKNKAEEGQASLGCGKWGGLGGLRGHRCADSQGPKIKASARSKADETRMDGVYDDVGWWSCAEESRQANRSELQLQGRAHIGHSNVTGRRQGGRLGWGFDDVDRGCAVCI